MTSAHTTMSGRQRTAGVSGVAGRAKTNTLQGKNQRKVSATNATVPTGTSSSTKARVLRKRNT